MVDWRVLQIWGGVKRKKLEEINAQALPSAILCSVVCNAFGGGTPVDPSKFLPFKLVDENSEVEKLRRKLKPSTLKVLRRVQNNLPPEIGSKINKIVGMAELLEEKEG